MYPKQLARAVPRVSFLGALFAFASAARAETIRIVAIGASNTAGYGVGAGQAWPSQLENLL